MLFEAKKERIYVRKANKMFNTFEIVVAQEEAKSGIKQVGLALHIKKLVKISITSS